MASASASRTARRRLLAPAIVVVASLGVRAAYQWRIEAYPKTELIRNALDDQFLYDQWARAILDGRDVDWQATGHEFAHWARRHPGVFPQDPLYPYALAGFYRLFGFAYDGLRALQAALGAATALLVWLLARAHVRPRAAMLAGLLAALYQPLVFYESTLLREPLATFLASAALAALAHAARAGTQRAVAAAAAGLAMGLAIVTRSHLAVPAAALACWLWLSLRRAFTGSVATTSAFVAATALPVLPVVIVNVARSGAPAFVSSSGPYNLFIGNVHDAEAAGPSSRYLEVKAQGPPEEVDLVRALAGDALRHPASLLRRLAEKTLRLFGTREAPDNLSVAMGRETNAALRLAFVTDAVLMPLALAGALLALARRRLALPYVWLVAYAASVIPFVVASRLRLPLLPALAVFGGFTLERAEELAASRRRWRAALVPAGVALLGVLLWPGREPHRLTDFQMAAAAYEARGRALEARGDAEPALKAYSRAVVLNPDHLGAVEAAARVQALLEPPPPDARAADLCARARAAADARRFDEALRLLEEAARAAPEWSLPAQYQANVHVLRGAPAAALPHLERAVALAPTDPRLRANLQALRRAAGVVR